MTACALLPRYLLARCTASGRERYMVAERWPTRRGGKAPEDEIGRCRQRRVSRARGEEGVP